MGRLQVNSPNDTNYSDIAHEYANDVVGGSIVACKWVKAACQRQLDDLDRQDNEDWPFCFDAEAANRACGYIERLRHVIGQLAGKPIVLEPWQIFKLSCVFGWRRRADGLRRFRSVYEELARKNAKTTILAGVGLYMLTADGEFGAEVYSAATKKEQARIVFDIASQMARQDHKFRARFGVRAYRHSLAVHGTGSKFVPLAADADSLDGLNISCGLIDELHAHKTRHVHDVIDSGMGARRQPLLWKITTAGSNRAGICYDQRIYMTKILNTTLRKHNGLGYRVEGDSAVDETFWGIIYTLDEGDDPLNEDVWVKANPNLNVSVDIDDMRRMAVAAAEQPAALNEFLTKRLDVWVNADSAWMNMLKWDACADLNLREEDFEGQPCIAALDAAFKKDLFAKVKIFRKGNDYYAFGRYYMPEALLETKGFEQVKAWAKQGWIRSTPGDTLDIESVREELIGSEACRKRGVEDYRLLGDVSGDAHRFDVQAICFDPAQLTQFSNEMLNDGYQMVEVRALVLNFSPAMKELEELVVGGRFHHNGDPVLGWAISNVVCHRDAKDNIYPRKEVDEKKIDPAIALIMALSRAILNKQEKSVYETRGFLRL